MLNSFAQSKKNSIPVIPLMSSDLESWLATQNDTTKNWVRLHSFTAQAGKFILIPAPNGTVAMVLLGIASVEDIWSYSALPLSLPNAQYQLIDSLQNISQHQACLGWALGGYQYDKYKSSERQPATLEWPVSVNRLEVEQLAQVIFMIRDLITTPAEDMGPAELAKTAELIAKQHQANYRCIIGDDLLKQNYPSVHMVGRASSRQPRLIDLRWGEQGPKITLVGKGVCFDSGGLDIKSASNMLLMKKDMGGAAHVLGLGALIMSAQLKVRLRLLVPAVDNSISGNAYRPLDVIRSRSGLTVEVGDTDAEGRLILSDALTEACSEKPDLLVDFATLTGAARVALGPDLPAFFCNHEETAQNLIHHAQQQHDPIWRLPLFTPYRKLLDSKVANIHSTGEGSYGGAITAALFLQEFVTPKTPWIHLDLMAWNNKNSPGRPVGGEAMALRAVYALIKQKASAALLN